MRGFGSLSLQMLVGAVKGGLETTARDGRRREMKKSEGGGYEVAVIPPNTALCSERKMSLADRS
jgi:hypothetical protein